MPPVVFRILGEPVSLEPASLSDRVRAHELLPFFYQLDDAALGAAIRRVEAQGTEISCRKGCSACCRAQPVPVTPPEAYHLLKLVESLPEPKRGETLARFEANAARLREQGLDTAYLDRDPAITREQARAIARRYFALGLVCPFLEADACGIYQHRPFVCRQYLVTSPANLCADPFANPVRPVPMPIAPASALLRAVSQIAGTPQHTIPMALALQYATANRAALETRHPARQLLESMLREVTA